MSSIKSAAGIITQSETSELTEEHKDFLSSEGFEFNEYLSYNGAFLFDQTNEEGIRIYSKVEFSGIIYCTVTLKNGEDHEMFEFYTADNFREKYGDVVSFIACKTTQDEDQS
jgi:hypothetical protein